MTRNELVQPPELRQCLALWQGFASRCRQAGVDPFELVKAASEQGLEKSAALSLPVQLAIAIVTSILSTWLSSRFMQQPQATSSAPATGSTDLGTATAAQPSPTGTPPQPAASQTDRQSSQPFVLDLQKLHREMMGGDLRLPPEVRDATRQLAVAVRSAPPSASGFEVPSPRLPSLTDVAPGGLSRIDTPLETRI